MSDTMNSNRVVKAFEALRASGSKALMPFLCGGHPAPGETKELIKAVAEAGATVIEVGIPFSDPIADGPVIASAMHDALERGSTVASVLDEVRAARESTEVPLVAMVSMSIVWAMGGPEGFARRVADAGFDGLIVPDAPLEESESLGKAAHNAGLTLSLLVAPTTPTERIEHITRACSGFVYLVARTGVTGERRSAPSIGPQVEAVRATTDLPIACGFGISTAEHVGAVIQHADAAIVGTALVRRINDAFAQGTSRTDQASAFTRELAQGLTHVTKPTESAQREADQMNQPQPQAQPDVPDPESEVSA